jgi:hypothetical protein
VLEAACSVAQPAEEAGDVGEARLGALGGVRAEWLAACAAAHAVKNTPGGVGAQDPAIVGVLEGGGDPRDRALEAGQVRVPLGQRATGHEQRPQVVERRGLRERVERVVGEREVAAG